jgi:hypothetical protein
VQQEKAKETASVERQEVIVAAAEVPVNKEVLAPTQTSEPITTSESSASLAHESESNELDDEDARALRIASGQEEGAAPKREYDDRRGRRSPYRRRGPRRPSNVRREHNNEQVAADFSAPAHESH